MMCAEYCCGHNLDNQIVQLYHVVKMLTIAHN